MNKVGGARNMMNICTKYGFDILIISGSYGGHRPHTTYDVRPTTEARQCHGYDGFYHKLPTGELTSTCVLSSLSY